MDHVDVTGLAYAVIDSPDIDGWEQFALDVIRAHPTRKNGDLLLRIDDRAQRVLVRPAAVDALGAIGWDVADGTLETARTILTASGRHVTDATPDELELRGVPAMIWTRDPDGNRVELVTMPNATPDASTKHPDSAIRGASLGHIVLMARQMEEMRSFYEDLLGFRVTDALDGDLMVFLRCNPRHHSLALLNAGVSGLNHLMVEVASIDDVGTAYDALRATRSHIAADLGRHSNDHAFSFYAWTPSEFMIEIGTGTKNIPPDALPARADDDLWGHHGLLEAHATLIQRAHTTTLSAQPHP